MGCEKNFLNFRNPSSLAFARSGLPFIQGLPLDRNDSLFKNKKWVLL